MMGVGQEQRSVRSDMSVIVSAFEGFNTLPLVLLGLARQTVLPAEVLIADDGSNPSLAAAVREISDLLPFSVTHVWQPNEGFRASRSRNNAIHLASCNLLAFLDQDTIPHHNWLEMHLKYVAPGRVCLARIFPLTEDETRSFTQDTVRSGVFEQWQAPQHWDKLRGQQRKYCFYALLRRLRLPFKPTRPSLSSGNISACRDDLLAVNGFDENYVGWGQEDDDLGRRLYMNGVRPIPILTRAFTTHAWHPSRHAEWHKGANLERYRKRVVSCRCVQGLDAHPHSDVVVTQIK
ncbi:MAG: glycosyltransferase [Kiritimatiellae bacterium]|nr:glycosyltransferase [Kiritimatiellia bacterium]